MEFCFENHCRWHKFMKLLKEQRDENRSKEIVITQLKNEVEQLKDALRNAFNKHLTELKLDTIDETMKTTLAIEEKSALVKSLKLSLEACDTTESIDGQIARAELEYRLGNEELELMDLQQKLEEKSNNNQQCFTDNELNGEESTLFDMTSCESMKGNLISIHSVEISNSTKGFVITKNTQRSGFVIDDIDISVTSKGLDLQAGDRVLEINGESVKNLNEEKINKLLKSNNHMKVVCARSQNKLKRLKDFEIFKNEMTELVHKLDHRINENKEMHAKYEKLLRLKSSLERNNKRQRSRINYLEEKLDAMIIGWKELRLTLDEQLHEEHKVNEENITREFESQTYEKLLNNHKRNYQNSSRRNSSFNNHVD